MLRLQELSDEELENVANYVREQLLYDVDLMPVAEFRSSLPDTYAFHGKEDLIHQYARINFSRYFKERPLSKKKLEKIKADIKNRCGLDEKLMIYHRRRFRSLWRNSLRKRAPEEFREVKKTDEALPFIITAEWLIEALGDSHNILSDIMEEIYAASMVDSAKGVELENLMQIRIDEEAWPLIFKEEFANELISETREKLNVDEIIKMLKRKPHVLVYPRWATKEQQLKISEVFQREVLRRPEM